MDIEDSIWARDREGRGSELVSGQDLAAIMALLKELRETTQSRRSFAVASDLLARIGRERDQSSLVVGESAGY